MTQDTTFRTMIYGKVLTMPHNQGSHGIIRAIFNSSHHPKSYALRAQEQKQGKN